MKAIRFMFMLVATTAACAVMIQAMSNPLVTAGHQEQPTSAENTEIFYASEDTYVNQNVPDANYGNSTQLDIRKDEFVQEHFSLLRFDLASIPAGSTVVSASLHAYLRDYDNDTSSARLSIYWGAASTTRTAYCPLAC